MAVSAPVLNGQRVTATLQFGGSPDDKQTVALDEEESPRRRQAALAAGTVLRDTYEIVRRIGQGGMGDVYEAKHARLTGRYAVKVLPPEFALNEAVLSRFHREAQIASGLQHPNIVQVIDFHETDDGTPYLVMEFLDGEDLAAWMDRRGPIPLAEAMPLVEQIGAALTAVHRRGIVHRDVKPQNVFLIPQENGRTLIKLVDFGLSKAHAPSLIVTRQPMLLGTPQYMAPEQALARGDQVGPATDQFALGAIIYQLLSGRPPFVGERISSVLYQIVHEEPPPLGAGVDGRVEAALRKALAKRPGDRFGSMAAFIDALREAMAAGALLPMPGIAESITRSMVIPIDKRRRNRWLAILGASAFLATLGGLIALRPRLGTVPVTPVRMKAGTLAQPMAAAAQAPRRPAFDDRARSLPEATARPAPASPPAAGTPMAGTPTAAATPGPTGGPGSRSKAPGARAGHAHPSATGAPAVRATELGGPAAPPTSPPAVPGAGTPRLVEDL